MSLSKITEFFGGRSNKRNQRNQRSMSSTSLAMPRKEGDELMLYREMNHPGGDNDHYEIPTQTLDIRIEIDVQIYSERDLQVRTIRRAMQGFPSCYASNMRWLSVVKVALGLILSGSLTKRDKVYSSILKRNLRFVWNSGSGPSEGESFSLNMKYPWAFDEEEFQLVISLKCSPSLSNGRPWWITGDTITHNLWTELGLKTTRDPSAPSDSILIE